MSMLTALAFLLAYQQRAGGVAADSDRFNVRNTAPADDWLTSSVAVTPQLTSAPVELGRALTQPIAWQTLNLAVNLTAAIAATDAAFICGGWIVDGNGSIASILFNGASPALSVITTQGVSGGLLTAAWGIINGPFASGASMTLTGTFSQGTNTKIAGAIVVARLTAAPTGAPFFGNRVVGNDASPITASENPGTPAAAYTQLMLVITDGLEQDLSPNSPWLPVSPPALSSAATLELAAQVMG